MRRVLITWAAAWPTITALLFALEGAVGHWPLALRTLLLTGLMVPAMTLLIVPALNRLLDRFSNNHRKMRHPDAQAQLNQHLEALSGGTPSCAGLPVDAHRMQNEIPIHTPATLFAFTVAIAAPFLRALVAKIERKKLFASPLAMVAVSYALTAIAPTFKTLVAARLIGALALPVFWAVGTATAAQLGGPDGGGKPLAILYASISSGTVIGIQLGVSLADLMG